MLNPASASVLLLGWDAASEALPLAHALPATTGVQLWLAEPVAAAALPGNATAQHLGGALPPAPDFATLGTAAPAYPYIGSSTYTTARSNLANEQRNGFQVPATPYIGSTPTTELLERQPASEPGVLEAAELSSQYTTVDEQADDLPLGAPADNAAPEAAASAPEPETTQADAPIFASAVPGQLAPAEVPAVEPTPEQRNESVSAQPEPLLSWAADLDGMNFRIIQYARHAVRLAHSATFDVVFAPDWPVWLAGVEIRHITHRPLVLRVTQLASDRPSPVDRGWGEALERLALPHADRVLVPDQHTAERLQAMYRIPAERLHVQAPGSAPDLTAALVLDPRLFA
ncbi:glycosyltransferase family 4 protein [Hymenobacter latericus]|uniref:glycosyltransferase family 4 protein n=1 Tax=Hymenobacter sp. YIM 151858-1 TaxID=2987688 RepID=UPI002225C4FD|nr:glycosyltransferase family 4 protein [Hymenobacter sp. YIM 151858-1]UYZ59367.1 glycosyltransferase family 4 protein [Hymenobacter sp. YIM 151858-1]